MSGLRFASGHVCLYTLPSQSRAFLALLASANRNTDRRGCLLRAGTYLPPRGEGAPKGRMRGAKPRLPRSARVCEPKHGSNWGVPPFADRCLPSPNRAPENRSLLTFPLRGEGGKRRSRLTDEGKPQVCGKSGVLRQKCHFATRVSLFQCLARVCKPKHGAKGASRFAA